MKLGDQTWSKDNPTPTNEPTLDDQIRARLEAMYMSALPVRNLDNGGEWEPGQDLETALGYHLPAVRNLIAQVGEQVIGKDEPIEYEYDKHGNALVPNHQEPAYFRNKVRAEQRARLAQLQHKNTKEES